MAYRDRREIVTRGKNAGQGRIRGRARGGAAFSIQFTGLSDDVNGRYGQIGNHAAISYTITPDLGTETVKWSNSPNPANPATFGTGASPTDFASVDGFSVYLHVTDQSVTRTFSFEVRKAPAVFGTDLDLSFGAGLAITPQNMLANLTANGNTLTFVSVTPALPSALSISSGGSMSGTPASVTADATYTATWEDEYPRQYTETFTLEITPVAQLTAVNMLAQLATGEVPVELTGDNGTYSWVLVTDDPNVSMTRPSRAQVLAGQTHTGATAPAAGTVVYTGGTVNVDLPDGLSGPYYLVMADGDSVLFDGTAQAIDSTAPVLTSPTGTQTGQTTANGSVTSDTAAGTLYAGVWPTAATPTAAEVVAGTGAVYHTSDATPTAGVNSFAATGLTAATAYKWHYVQDDEFSQRSTVATSAEFTTASAMSVTRITRVESGDPGTFGTVRTTTIDLSGYGSGDKIVVFAGAEHLLTTTLSDHSLQGITPTSVTNGGGHNNGQRCAVLIFDLNTTGSASASLSLTYQSATSFESVSIWGVKGGNVAVWVGGFVLDTAWPFTGTGPTPSNATNIVIATIMGRESAQTATWTNMTEEGELAIDVGSGLFTFIGDARAVNVPTSPFLPTGSMSVTGRKGGAMIVVTP